MTTRKAGPWPARRRTVFRRTAHFPLNVLRINEKTIKSGDRDPKWDHEVGANIGLEGLGILSEKRLPPHAEVTVEFLLPGEDAELLRANAHLRLSKANTEGKKKLHFMDLEFTRLSAKTHTHIQRFLDEPS